MPVAGLQKSILEDPEAAMSMSELNVEYRMSVEEYKESSPYPTEAMAFYGFLWLSNWLSNWLSPVAN